MQIKRENLSSGRNGFAVSSNLFCTIIEIYSHGLMELLKFHNPAKYKLKWSSSRQSHLIFHDIIFFVFKSHIQGLHSVSEIAEFDNKNDEHVGLLLMVSTSDKIIWLRAESSEMFFYTRVILLRNERQVLRRYQVLNRYSAMENA